MTKQDELDEMKEDAERGHGIDCEKTLDLILDINRLTRLMPHIGGTCKHQRLDRLNGGIDLCDKDESLICEDHAPCFNREWELKE